MAITDVQGRLQPLLVSDDNWTTSYTLVCLADDAFDSQFAVNQEDSQCATHTGIGTLRFSFKFNAVVNITPATVVAGVGEASYKKILTWHLNQTLLAIKQDHGTAGADYKIEGSFYLNQVSHQVKVGDVMKFSGTFTGTGVPVLG